MTDFRQQPNVREQLDAIRPDSLDLCNPDLQAVAQAIDASDRWRATFENQQAIDQQLSAAMQDVPLPDGFMDRLLANLSAAGESTDIAPTETANQSAVDESAVQALPTPNRRTGRREWAYTVTAAAGVAACIGLGLFLWSGGPATLSLDEIRQRVPLTADKQIDLSGLRPFDDSFPLSLPFGRWERLQVGDAVGLDWSDEGRHDAALLPFSTRAGRALSGYLLIVPASSVTSPPDHTFLSTAGISYFPVDNTAWTSTSGELVYVCFVDPGKLPDLQQLLYPHSA